MSIDSARPDPTAPPAAGSSTAPPAAGTPPAGARRSRVLFFHTAQGARLTGGPRMVWQLASRLDRKRFEPCFVSPGETELSRALQDDGVDVRFVPLPPGLDVYGQGLTRPGPIRALRALAGIVRYNRQISRLIRDFDADLIWVSNLRTFLSIYPAVWRRRVPVIWNIWLGQKSAGIVRFMNAFAVRQAKRIVTEYHAQASEIFTRHQLETAEPKLRTVYTGHEVPERSRAHVGSPGDVVRVGTMGAFSPRKNQRLFLEAARRIVDEHPNVRFLLAGEAATPREETYAKELRAFVAEHGLEEWVEWCGWISKPHEFLDRLDIYVQSSEHEGLPGAVREAMLNGLPVVGTNVGGTGEIIVDGETGHLVDRGDANAIVDAILRLEADPAHAASMGSNGRRRAEQLFSRDAFLASYQKVLDDVLVSS